MTERLIIEDAVIQTIVHSSGVQSLQLQRVLVESAEELL